MSMLLIVLLVVLALLYNLFAPPQWRSWLIFIGSMVVVYWLSIASTPFGSIVASFVIGLSLLTWFVTRQPDQLLTLEDRRALVFVTALIICAPLVELIIGSAHYTGSVYRIIGVLSIMATVTSIAVFQPHILILRIFKRRNMALTFIIALILILLCSLKVPWLREPIAIRVADLGKRGVVAMANSIWPAIPATALDRLEIATTIARFINLPVLGFSYVAFRLIQTLQARITGKLPTLPLHNYLTFVFFFASYVAGPIDRVERFHKDIETLPQDSPDKVQLTGSLSRILIGCVKKFVIADLLGLLAPNQTIVHHHSSQLWLWGLTYLFAFQIYFDFAGYTDIAIGLGRLVGIHLPENFNRPYLKTDIGAFWQSWHISLGNWMRVYVFSPLARQLRLRTQLPSLLMVLIAQVTTMVLLGLWHGITLNFLIWGIWHGVGLFIHKCWSDSTRQWYYQLNTRSLSKVLWRTGSTLLTFHFVVLGWIWFFMPTPQSAIQLFRRLFNI
jgi:alginate O-acetyltransferase complex protein AlgI